MGETVHQVAYHAETKLVAVSVSKSYFDPALYFRTMIQRVRFLATAVINILQNEEEEKPHTIEEIAPPGTQVHSSQTQTLSPFTNAENIRRRIQIEFDFPRKLANYRQI